MCSIELMVNISGRPLGNQTLQTERNTGPLAKVQLCEYENQTLETTVVASRLNAKFDCLVAGQNCSQNCSATVHDCDFNWLIVHISENVGKYTNNLQYQKTKSLLNGQWLWGNSLPFRKLANCTGL